MRDWARFSISCAAHCDLSEREEQALDIVTIASLFNFIDRVADALGVELDPMMKQMAESATDGEALTEVAAPMRARSKGVTAKGT
ncbi:MAG TPA: hypothetical protein VNO74_00470 [Methylomirabilota bacterium]|nr:hypothetical protein [Methylomirabilota bacterium]